MCQRSHALTSSLSYSTPVVSNLKVLTLFSPIHLYLSLILNFILIFHSLDFGLLKCGASFAVPLTGLLGVSHEWFHWRMGLFHFHILAGYGNFGYTTSIFFHCHLSLHLPFKWEFSIQIQSESHSEYIIFFTNFWLEF